MTAIKSHHSRVFEQLIKQRREVLTEALVSGAPADHFVYRQLVGQIQGLADALKISEQADYNLSGDEPDVGA